MSLIFFEFAGCTFGRFQHLYMLHAVSEDAYYILVDKDWMRFNLLVIGRNDTLVLYNRDFSNRSSILGGVVNAAAC